MSTIKVDTLNTRTGSGNITFSRPITGLSGSGASLTALNATEITSGTIPIARIADDAITLAKMADDAIGVAQLSATGTASNSVFLRGDNSWAAAGGGKVLQVIQTHDITRRSQSLSAATTANISGLNATITPSATTSKILVSVRWNGEGSVSDLQDSVFGINRDSTEIGAAAHAGSRQGGIATISMGYYLSEVTTTPDNCYYEYLDSPSSTSAITYHGTVSAKTAMTLYTNGSVSDTDANWGERVTSTITLWEIGA